MTIKNFIGWMELVAVFGVLFGATAGTVGWFMAIVVWVAAATGALVIAQAIDWTLDK